MRPAVIDLGRDYRGGQHQALLLLRGLVKRGHLPELIAVRDSPLARRAQGEGISVRGISPGRRRFSAALAIRELARGRHIDIVHANEPHALSSAWLAGAHRFVPLVALRRIALPLSESTFALARYRAAARIVAVSNFVKHSVIASGFSADKVQVIYDGVELAQAAEVSGSHDNEVAQTTFRSDTPCLGNIAALAPEKGHALLLEAFALLRAQFPQCTLLIAGQGPERARLDELARRLRVADAVQFLGELPDITELLRKIDVFVFPSHAEPLGSALLAAMARGVPVVAIAAGGVPEVIDDGRNGLLTRELSPPALAQAISTLLSDRVQAKLLGRAARERIATHFSADRMVDGTVQLYEEVAGQFSPVR